MEYLLYFLLIYYILLLKITKPFVILFIFPFFFKLYPQNNVTNKNAFPSLAPIPFLRTIVSLY